MARANGRQGGNVRRAGTLLHNSYVRRSFECCTGINRRLSALTYRLGFAGRGQWKYPSNSGGFTGYYGNLNASDSAGVFPGGWRGPTRCSGPRGVPHRQVPRPIRVWRGLAMRVRRVRRSGLLQAHARSGGAPRSSSKNYRTRQAKLIRSVRPSPDPILTAATDLAATRSIPAAARAWSGSRRTLRRSRAGCCRTRFALQQRTATRAGRDCTSEL